MATFLALLLGAEVVSVLVLHQVATNQLDDRVTDRLTVVADDLEVRLANEAPALGQADGETVRSLLDQFLQTHPAAADQAFLAIVDGRPYATSAAAPVALDTLPQAATWASLRTSATGEADSFSGPVRWLAVPILAGDDVLAVFVAAELVGPQQDELRGTVAAVAAFIALVLVVASLLAWGAAGRALRPVRRLASAAHAVEDGDDLGARVPVDGTDEVGELARSVNGMLDRLERSFESQREFLDDAGHELRAPITVVRGHLELLDDDPEVRAEEVAVVLDELDRMERLVTDLRLLARSERPDFLVLHDVDVEALARELVAKAATIAPRDWRLDLRIAGSVRADRQRVTEAVLNLCVNATAVTADGDPIELVVDRRGRALELAVRDHGPGIPAEDLPTLFDRSGRAVRRRVSGTGLGLPIVAAIAHAHHGEAHVDSEVGVGTTVSITIPGLQPADPRPVAPSSPPSPRPAMTDPPAATDPTTTEVRS